MSKLYVTKDEIGNIVFGKEKAETVPAAANGERMARSEVLDFISYLRRKEKVEIENRIEVRRTLLNSYPYALSKIAKDVLSLIKKASGAEDAYCRLASEAAKANSKHRIMPGFAYVMEEDLTEYLIGCGYDDEEAKKLTSCIENRAFKRSVWENDERLTENFKVWAAASAGMLMSRRYVTNLFRLEYLEFRAESTDTDDVTYTVYELSTRGPYNGYGYSTSRLMEQSGDGLILGYRDNYHRLDKEKLIILSEMLCKETGLPEMWIRDMNEDKVTVVRRKDDEAQVETENDPHNKMTVVGRCGDYLVGIYPNDGVYSHFHLVNTQNGERLALSLQKADYYRHNANEKAFLDEKDVSELCEWLDSPSEEYENAGLNVTNYQNLCVLWNQNSNKAKFAVIERPEYEKIN